jgi:isohexenylglutaconyl-CoA hydratase
VNDFKNLETLVVEIRDFAAHITLNRPESRNAMSFKMVEEITEIFTALHDNRNIRAVVLSGAEGTFCSGADIKELRDNPIPASGNKHILETMLRAVNQAPQIVIAKVQGAAMGGGFGLVCVSDIAIADIEAQFGMPEVRLGVAPSYISPFVLQRLGLTRARELMLTGRRFNGKKAQEYGLVHIACGDNEIEHFMEDQLEEIRQCAPEAIAAVKELIWTVYDASLDETLDYRANLINSLRQGAEAQEGMLAFVQKRPAKWVTGGES